jgi:hypothetical protein
MVEVKYLETIGKYKEGSIKDISYLLANKLISEGRAELISQEECIKKYIEAKQTEILGKYFNNKKEIRGNYFNNNENSLSVESGLIDCSKYPSWIYGVFEELNKGYNESKNCYLKIENYKLKGVMAHRCLQLIMALARSENKDIKINESLVKTDNLNRIRLNFLRDYLENKYNSSKELVNELSSEELSKIQHSLKYFDSDCVFGVFDRLYFGRNAVKVINQLIIKGFR